MDWLEQIKTAQLPELDRGSHKSPSDGLCVMEMVAFVEGLEHSDTPRCTDPGIAAYAQVGNDYMGAERRQRLLLPLVPRLAGTNNPVSARARAEHFAMAAATRFAVMACRGRIADELVDAMANAETLADAHAAAAVATDAAAADAVWDAYIEVLIDAIELDLACREAKTYPMAKIRELEAL